MATTRCEIRPGAYHDSIVLMQLQRALAEQPGVLDAGVVMATPANRDLLATSELLPKEAANAGVDDLLIVVKAGRPEEAESALTQVDALLRQRRSTVSSAFRPRSLRSATQQLPHASWVLISVPGRYAADVAGEALDLGKHVFLYSDNVRLPDEIALKQKATEKGLLMMGPDCGTAIINGIGLGFANRVRRGRVGLVGASGTGLQAITSELHNRGAGVSQAIGTGGRDLSEGVGAATALQALDVLAREPETDVIVLVSKPPAPAVATRLLQAASRTGKPVVVSFMGYPPPARQWGVLRFATTLTEAAELAVKALGEPGSQQTSNVERDGYVRALFSGGTLAYEAMLGLQTWLYPLYSNVPVRSDQKLENPLQSRAHTVLDLGEDLFTQGRLHPMMDNDLRIRRMRQEAADPETGLLLLDVVLGEGAHPNPASELAPVIASLKHERDIQVLAIVVGTDEDPQDRAAQVEQLKSAGARVFTEPGQALAAAVDLVRSPEVAGPSRQVDMAPFQAPFAAINVGLESFAESLEGQGAEVVHVAWRPPAGGNEKLMALLAKMKS